MLFLVESVREVAGVGRVRGTTFRDQRGPGGVFRLMPAHGASIERLELSPEALSLALEPRGLVLIVGPRRSGKRSTISALVGHMNRTRRDHVITIERDVTVAHERGTSIVSQREVSGPSDDVEAAVRLALREDPDVLVIDSIRTASLVRLALDAAAAGRLVIAGLAAQDTASAVGHVIDLHPAETRGPLQLALARNLRGIVAQVLLRRADGGQVAAREVVLNTPAVASVIAEGRLSQLPMAIDAARTVGMPRLNDALASLVQKGTVDVREAYRKAVDPAGLLAKLKRLGLDTTAISP
jgi:twitching motility protein PilT